MALTFKTPSGELKDALALTAERETGTGRLWCPPKISEAIRIAIVDRSESLGDLIWQVVPFARFAALCSKRGYVELIYGTVQTLRSEAFRAALTRLKSSGSFERGLLDIEATGIALLDVTPSTGARYEITYAQMPRLAAFLDVLHNTIGFAEVDALLAPMTKRTTPPPIGEVARPLRNRFNEWLAPRLESNHRRSQAKILHAFLAARSALSADRIDDETVLAFWQERATHWHQRCEEEPAAIEQAQKEGFRTFESVVNALLAYRDALEDALTERRMTNSVEVTSTASIIIDQATARRHLRLVVGAVDHPGIAEETIGDVWLNPIAAFARPPANSVKWLTQKEVQQLAHFVGRNGAGDEAAESHGGSTEAGLMFTSDNLQRDRPFNHTLARTLLRLDVFAPVQAAITKSRDKRTPEERLDRALSVVPASYVDAAAVYSLIAGQLRLELLVALHILALAADPMAILIIDHLGDIDAVRVITGGDDQEKARAITSVDDHEEARQRNMVSKRLASAFAGDSEVDPAIQPLVREARAVRNRVARQGFERGSENIEGLCSSVPHAIVLHQHLSRLSQRLAAAVAGYDIGADRAQFTATLKKLYAGSAREAMAR